MWTDSVGNFWTHQQVWALCCEHKCLRCKKGNRQDTQTCTPETFSLISELLLHSQILFWLSQPNETPNWWTTGGIKESINLHSLGVNLESGSRLVSLCVHVPRVAMYYRAHAPWMVSAIIFFFRKRVYKQNYINTIYRQVADLMLQIILSKYKGRAKFWAVLDKTMTRKSN